MPPPEDSDKDKKDGDSDGNKKDGDGDGKAFSQEELDKIVHKRVMQERDQHKGKDDEIATLKSKLEEAEKSSKKDDDDDKADEDKKTVDVEEIVSKAVTAALKKSTEIVDEKLAAKDKELVKQKLINEHGKNLIPAMHGQVKGDTEEEIKTSIKLALDNQAEQLKGANIQVGQTFGKGGVKPNPEGKTFTRSQIRNTKFYKENKAEILEAQREGRIVND